MNQMIQCYSKCKSCEIIFNKLGMQIIYKRMYDYAVETLLIFKMYFVEICYYSAIAITIAIVIHTDVQIVTTMLLYSRQTYVIFRLNMSECSLSHEISIDIPWSDQINSFGQITSLFIPKMWYSLFRIRWVSNNECHLFFTVQKINTTSTLS